mmetsp:Transcript_44982/g.125141  ORF Transcript_44982/g.125141 Transcript_44982/m.125141 type:complete len:337 (-) Transcript_44982:584-1594(-)
MVLGHVAVCEALGLPVPEERGRHDDAAEGERKARRDSHARWADPHDDKGLRTGRFDGLFLAFAQHLPLHGELLRGDAAFGRRHGLQAGLRVHPAAGKDPEGCLHSGGARRREEEGPGEGQGPGQVREGLVRESAEEAIRIPAGSTEPRRLALRPGDLLVDQGGRIPAVAERVGLPVVNDHYGRGEEQPHQDSELPLCLPLPAMPEPPGSVACGLRAGFLPPYEGVRGAAHRDGEGVEEAPGRPGQGVHGAGRDQGARGGGAPPLQRGAGVRLAHAGGRRQQPLLPARGPLGPAEPISGLPRARQHRAHARPEAQEALPLRGAAAAADQLHQRGRDQ